MIIDLDKEYEFFFIEDFDAKIFHPVSDFTYQLGDLSINLLISLKWARWGYFFLSELSNNLEKIKEEISFENLIRDSIQDDIKLENKTPILLLDDIEIKSNEEFEKRIQEFYLNKDFKDVFTENTKIDFKLKLNLNEYLALTNTIKPVLVKFSK